MSDILNILLMILFCIALLFSSLALAFFIIHICVGDHDFRRESDRELVRRVVKHMIEEKKDKEYMQSVIGGFGYTVWYECDREEAEREMRRKVRWYKPWNSRHDYYFIPKPA